MSDVNTAIYQNQVQPSNPLTTATQVIGLQQGLNQNKLFQQQNAARVAIGNAYQQSIDPTTGQLDTNKLLSTVAQDPNAAYMAGDVASQAQQRQQQQLGITGAQIDQGVKKLGWVNNQTAALLAKPNVSRSDVIDSLVSGLNSGILTKNDVVNEITSIPSDPAQLTTYLQQHQLKAMDQAQQFSAIYGTPQILNNGGTQTPVAISPMTGVHQLGGPIANTLTPGESAARVNTFHDGQPGTVPQSALVTPTGQPIATPAPGATAGYTGRYPGAAPGQPPLGAQPGAGVPPAVAPTGAAGFVATGPKLGESTAADATAKASADQGVSLQQTADQVPARKAALSNLEADLQNFTSGPGADWTKVAKSAVNRFNPLGDIFDPQKIASQDSFTKQATQLATAQLSTLGGAGTDSKLDAAIHTNPSAALSKLGNEQIIGLLKGNEDAIAVKNQEWQKYLAPVAQGGQGGSPADYGAFTTQFNKAYDPRVFQSTYMSDPQKADMVKAMSQAELKQFQTSYNYAAARGWIPNPLAGAPANAGQ